MGVLAGSVNAHLGIDMSLGPWLLGWLLVSIMVVVFLHEGLHAGVAGLLGHKASFGLRPPLVYVTFTGKLPRGHYMLVAITPFVILNLLFGLLLAAGELNLFFNLSLIVNSIGSMGDIWGVLMLAGGPRGAMIQDTKSGFEVWVADEAINAGLGIPKEV
jgi:hypothetical protein